MNNPFINTMLYTTIALHPSQLNNQIYSNLKQNLIRTLEKKCYKDYGYICKIYEILERDNGIIVPEDITSSVSFKIKFSCRLCHPLENTQIICKVNQISDTFISLIRDPIHVIVTTDRINKNIFHHDTNDKKIKMNIGNTVLEPNTFVKVTIVAKTFIHKDRKILAVGILDDVASDNDVENFYSEEYSKDTHIVDFDTYVGNDTESTKD